MDERRERLLTDDRIGTIASVGMLKEAGDKSIGTVLAEEAQALWS